MTNYARNQAIKEAGIRLLEISQTGGFPTSRRAKVPPIDVRTRQSRLPATEPRNAFRALKVQGYFVREDLRLPESVKFCVDYRIRKGYCK